MCYYVANGHDNRYMTQLALNQTFPTSIHLAYVSCKSFNVTHVSFYPLKIISDLHIFRLITSARQDNTYNTSGAYRLYWKSNQ